MPVAGQSQLSAGFTEADPIADAQVVDRVTPPSTLTAPEASPSTGVLGPDAKAIRSSAERTGAGILAAVRGGDPTEPHILSNDLQDIGVESIHSCLSGRVNWVNWVNSLRIG